MGAAYVLGVMVESCHTDRTTVGFSLCTTFRDGTVEAKSEVTLTTDSGQEHNANKFPSRKLEAAATEFATSWRLCVRTCVLVKMPVAQQLGVSWVARDSCSCDLAWLNFSSGKQSTVTAQSHSHGSGAELRSASSTHLLPLLSSLSNHSSFYIDTFFTLWLPPRWHLILRRSLFHPDHFGLQTSPHSVFTAMSPFFTSSSLHSFRKCHLDIFPALDFHNHVVHQHVLFSMRNVVPELLQICAISRSCPLCHHVVVLTLVHHQ